MLDSESLSPEQVFEKAEYAFDKGELRDAAELWASLGDMPEALFNAANSYREVGETDLAEKFYRRAIAAGEKDSYLNLAGLLESENREAEARSILLAGMEAGDRASVMQYSSNISEDDPRKAISLLTPLANDEEEFATLVLARAHESLDRQSPIVERLLKSIPHSDEAVLRLAAYYSANGRLAEAQGLLEELLARGYRDAAVPLGNILQDSRSDPEGAEAAYAKGAHLGEEYARFNLGELLVRLGREGEGMEHIRRAALAGDALAIKWLDANDAT